MNQHDSQFEAAAILAARRRGGLSGERLPLACRPADAEAGLAIQAAVSQVLDIPVGGWKCALPAAGMPVAAPIYASTIHRASPCKMLLHRGLARIEPELAFILARDLPARAAPYSQLEIDVAVGATHLALELIGSRYAAPAEVTFAESLADGLVNQGLFIGPQVDDARAARAAAMQIRITGADGLLDEFAGVHPAGHPRAPLYWLVEFLRSRGQGLLAGQAVITGSYAGSIDLPSGQDLTIYYGELGALTVNFAQA